MHKDKLYKKLLELYECVYSSIGIDFHEIDKTDNWFMNYQIDEEAEDTIVNDFINSNRLSALEKKVLRQNYYLGISPRVTKIEKV